ncbi:hypothetical protein IFM89_001908, partial [Coptis chinensis]
HIVQYHMYFIMQLELLQSTKGIYRVNNGVTRSPPLILTVVMVLALRFCHGHQTSVLMLNLKARDRGAMGLDDGVDVKVGVNLFVSLELWKVLPDVCSLPNCTAGSRGKVKTQMMFGASVLMRGGLASLVHKMFQLYAKVQGANNMAEGFNENPSTTYKTMRGAMVAVLDDGFDGKLGRKLKVSAHGINNVATENGEPVVIYEASFFTVRLMICWFD